MQFFKKASIRHKQTAIIMLTTGVALLLVCAAFVVYEILTFRKSMVANLTTHAEIIGNNSSAALDFNDKEVAQETISALRAEPDIVAACLYLKDGTPFVVYIRPGIQEAFEPPPVRWSGHYFGEQHLGLFRPIVQKGETIGAVYLKADLQSLYDRLFRYALIVVTVLILALLVAYFISASLQGVICEPILELVRTTRTVTQNEDYSLRVPRHNDDELGVLIEGFNGMLAQIQARDAALQKAQTELEKRVAERTAELANSLSLLHATLESTADGILVTDCSGTVTNFNEKFLSMWQIPPELARATQEDRLLIDAVLPQLKDPVVFVSRVQELYGRPEEESFDTLELQDGKVFERHSKPQKVGNKHVGRVWSFRNVTERRRAEEELKTMHSQLLNASRQAGMAEVATNVLHNVGNVLNSVNVSSAIISNNIRSSKLPNLERMLTLLQEHADDLPGFFANAKGKQVLPFLTALTQHLANEKEKLLLENESLRKNVEHINEIVAMQQQYARISGVLDVFKVEDLVEDALRMNNDGMERQQVSLLREYSDVPPVLVDKHKVLQILVNLIRNARQAVNSTERPVKSVTIKIGSEGKFVQISVIDNGVGIAAENMVQIFAHGFTTRKGGHGFGLHSSALAAKELGGTLTVQSDGPEKGASFTLSLPVSEQLSVQS